MSKEDTKQVVLVSEHKTYALAQHLMKTYSFLTPEDTERIIYVYHEDLGIYKPDARVIIDIECQKALRELASEGVISYIRNTIARETYFDREKFDAIGNLVCVKNGILNLDTLELNPHSPQIPFLRYIPVDWNPNIDCKLFKEALAKTFSEKDACYMKQYIGYFLIPKNIYKRACIVVGDHDTGKTKIVEACRNMLGGKTYTSSLSLQDLDHNFLPAQLEGKTANIRSEITSKDMKHYERFKNLVSTDTITVHKKNQQPFELENKAKFLFTSNKLPPDPNDDAYTKRLLILVANHNYDECNDGDEYIDYKLNAPDELSGMLNFALEGYKMLRKNHDFFPKQSIQEIRNLYTSWSGDNISKFISSKIEITPNSRISKDAVYAEYCSFCLDNGNESSLTKNAFWLSLKSKIKVVDIQESASRNPARPWMVIGISLLQ